MYASHCTHSLTFELLTVNCRTIHLIILAITPSCLGNFPTYVHPLYPFKNFRNATNNYFSSLSHSSSTITYPVIEHPVPPHHDPPHLTITHPTPLPEHFGHNIPGYHDSLYPTPSQTPP